MKISYINSFLSNFSFNGRRKRTISISKAELEEYIIKHPNLSLAQIAKHFYISRTTAERLIKEYGITAYKTRKHGLPSSNIKKDDLTAYIKQNPKFTQEQIAQNFTTSNTTISKLIKAYDIDIYVNKSRNHPLDFTKEDLERLITEHPEYTERQIADYFEVSISTISKCIEKYDIDYVRYKYPY